MAVKCTYSIEFPPKFTLMGLFGLKMYHLATFVSSGSFKTLKILKVTQPMDILLQKHQRPVLRTKLFRNLQGPVEDS
jgi:hypothetical protein